MRILLTNTSALYRCVTIHCLLFAPTTSLASRRDGNKRRTWLYFPLRRTRKLIQINFHSFQAKTRCLCKYWVFIFNNHCYAGELMLVIKNKLSAFQQHCLKQWLGCRFFCLLFYILYNLASLNLKITILYIYNDS